MIPASLAFLLRAQALDRRRPRRELAAVVRRLVALQAQIPSTPYLSMAARVEGVTAGDVDALLERRALLRVWSLRGTLHVIDARDLPLVHGAIMRDWQEIVRRMVRRFDGLSDQQIRANERAILRELEKGPRTRSELRAAIPTVTSLYWGREIRSLCCAGLVVHAGTRGGEAVFDLLERWAPRARTGGLSVREAQRDLLVRYLDGYGPATPRDFAYWLGIGVRDAERAFADARGRLRETEDGFVRRDADYPPQPMRSPPPRLLPRFDVFVLGHRDKSRYLDARDYKKVFRPAAVVEPVMMVDGRVAGTWGYEGVKLSPFRAIPASARRALDAERARLRA